eukprot:1855202-Alexandrium_andersonii.AAC.1
MPQVHGPQTLAIWDRRIPPRSDRSHATSGPQPDCTGRPQPRASGCSCKGGSTRSAPFASCEGFKDEGPPA